MNLSLTDTLIIAAATWRLAFMVVREQGPFTVFEKLRARTTLGGLLDCVACVSLWVAFALLALWVTPLRPVVYIPAISAIGLMAASWTGVEFKHD